MKKRPTPSALELTDHMQSGLETKVEDDARERNRLDVFELAVRFWRSTVMRRPRVNGFLYGEAEEQKRREDLVMYQICPQRCLRDIYRHMFWDLRCDPRLLSGTHGILRLLKMDSNALARAVIEEEMLCFKFLHGRPISSLYPLMPRHLRECVFYTLLVLRRATPLLKDLTQKILGHIYGLEDSSLEQRFYRAERAVLCTVAGTAHDPR